MLIKDVKKLSPFDRFIYWIKEREAIRIKKEAGKPKPWSDDEVMQSCYFTNVSREDDKVTRWVKANIRDPLKGKPEVVFAIIAFRWFNYIPTGELLATACGKLKLENGLLCKWDVSKAIEWLGYRKLLGQQVFTGAFIITTGGKEGSKLDTICKDMIQPAWECRKELYENITVSQRSGKRSLEMAHGYLSNIPGLGGSGFMAAQVICDLAYTHVLPEDKCSDWWTWSSPGPGSKKGMNILLGRPLEDKVKDWQLQMDKLREQIAKKIPKLKLHARDLQNCLCEYSKMCRILEGGRSKRGYQGY